MFIVLFAFFLHFKTDRLYENHNLALEQAQKCGVLNCLMLSQTSPFCIIGTGTKYGQYNSRVRECS